MVKSDRSDTLHELWSFFRATQRLSDLTSVSTHVKSPAVKLGRKIVGDNHNNLLFFL